MKKKVIMLCLASVLTASQLTACSLPIEQLKQYMGGEEAEKAEETEGDNTASYDDTYEEDYSSDENYSYNSEISSEEGTSEVPSIEAGETPVAHFQVGAVKLDLYNLEPDEIEDTTDGYTRAQNVYMCYDSVFGYTYGGATIGVAKANFLAQPSDLGLSEQDNAVKLLNQFNILSLYNINVDSIEPVSYSTFTDKNGNEWGLVQVNNENSSGVPDISYHALTVAGDEKAYCVTLKFSALDYALEDGETYLDMWATPEYLAENLSVREETEEEIDPDLGTIWLDGVTAEKPRDIYGIYGSGLVLHLYADSQEWHTSTFSSTASNYIQRSFDNGMLNVTEEQAIQHNITDARVYTSWDRTDDEFNKLPSADNPDELAYFYSEMPGSTGTICNDTVWDENTEFISAETYEKDGDTWLQVETKRGNWRYILFTTLKDNAFYTLVVCTDQTSAGLQTPFFLTTSELRNGLSFSGLELDKVGTRTDGTETFEEAQVRGARKDQWRSQQAAELSTTQVTDTESQATETTAEATQSDNIAETTVDTP